jgi:imidazolonepropionase-like amidohydrolase
MLTHLTRCFTNVATLRAATSVNAELLALSNLRNPYPGELGVIEQGALADVLVVNGNPPENIRLIEDPRQSLAVIMKDGRLPSEPAVGSRGGSRGRTCKTRASWTLSSPLA